MFLLFFVIIYGRDKEPLKEGYPDSPDTHTHPKKRVVGSCYYCFCLHCILWSYGGMGNGKSGRGSMVFEKLSDVFLFKKRGCSYSILFYCSPATLD